MHICEAASSNIPILQQMALMYAIQDLVNQTVLNLKFWLSIALDVMWDSS